MIGMALQDRQLTIILKQLKALLCALEYARIVIGTLRSKLTFILRWLEAELTAFEDTAKAVMGV